MSTRKTPSDYMRAQYDPYHRYHELTEIPLTPDGFRKLSYIQMLELKSRDPDLYNALLKATQEADQCRW